MPDVDFSGTKVAIEPPYWVFLSSGDLAAVGLARALWKLYSSTDTAAAYPMNRSRRVPFAWRKDKSLWNGHCWVTIHPVNQWQKFYFHERRRADGARWSQPYKRLVQRLRNELFIHSENWCALLRKSFESLDQRDTAANCSFLPQNLSRDWPKVVPLVLFVFDTLDIKSVKLFDSITRKCTSHLGNMFTRPPV